MIVYHGELLMWYTDDSLFASGQPQVKTYMLRASDPVTWVPDQGHATNLINEPSIDVKYDSSLAQFVMIRVENEFSSNAYLGRAHSSDAVTWTIPESVFPPTHSLHTHTTPGSPAMRQGTWQLPRP